MEFMGLFIMVGNLVVTKAMIAFKEAFKKETCKVAFKEAFKVAFIIVEFSIEIIIIMAFIWPWGVMI